MHPEQRQSWRDFRQRRRIHSLTTWQATKDLGERVTNSAWTVVLCALLETKTIDGLTMEERMGCDS